MKHNPSVKRYNSFIINHLFHLFFQQKTFKIVKKKLLSIALSLLLTTLFLNCKRTQISETVKMHPTDPFKSTMVESQYFDIKANQDNVIEGLIGTIIIMPKGCFKDENDNIVESDVKIELAESLSMSDILLSNLNTTSNGKLLETDGMIYFNATANGKQLTINRDNPIHIEMPTNKKKPNMMVYKGVRDEKGNMNWTEPKVINNYLTTVDLNSLDFLPEGFQKEVERNMPYKNYTVANQNLVDSLYYCFSDFNGRQFLRVRNLNFNEAYYNRNKKVENGKYTSDSYEYNEHGTDSDQVKSDTSKAGDCGIDPAIIKVIKSEKYQNTLIATREFEARLKVIFKTCKNSILEIYIKNLDKNLYELDEMAMKALDENEQSQREDFERFAQQRLTKVKNADKYAELLRGYYQTQLAKVKSELEQNQEKVRKALEKQNKKADNLIKDYKKLLFKREKFRMETYGFEWTNTGWINVDNGILPKTWGEQPLEVTINNGKSFDRVYTYVIYESIKSLYRLNTDDNEQFHVGNNEDKMMLMPKKEKAIVIAIGYNAEIPFLTIQEFETGSEPKITLSLSNSSTEKVREAINNYEKYSTENKISEDLKYMEAFYREQQRQKVQQEEYILMMHLLNFVEPCCAVTYEWMLPSQ